MESEMKKEKFRREFDVVNNANARVITIRVVLPLEDGDDSVREALEVLGNYGSAEVIERSTVTNSFSDACAILRTQAV
jgi:hypothetical protein